MMISNPTEDNNDLITPIVGNSSPDVVKKKRKSRTKKPKPVPKGRPKSTIKKVGYRPEMRSIMLEMSKRGKSLTQIAVALADKFNMPIIADTLIGWEKTAGETYAKYLKLCRTYSQAYHEDLLEAMISGDIKSGKSDIEAQKWKLKTLFADWGDKAQKIELSQTEQMDDKSLEAKVMALMKRTGKLPIGLVPKLKVVGTDASIDSEKEET